MRTVRLLAPLLGALLLVAPAARSQENGGGNGPAKAPDERLPELPGFVAVPGGEVQPGCTIENFKLRAQNDELKKALIYDIWGAAGNVHLPTFLIQKYTVTNAQWKLYLDRNFRTEHTTNGQETLEDISKKYVSFRGKEDPTEWKAIYAFNWRTIRDALVQEKKWVQAWTVLNPSTPGNGIEKVHLPEGLKLTFYTKTTPTHWYGWCRLSDLNTGREYCDITKVPEAAFTVPEDEEELKSVRFRAKDFAAFPVRALAPVEILAFAEWAGCHLPSEYEYEYAGRSNRPNTDQHTFAGPWKRAQQPGFFGWADNKANNDGPLAVDDPSVEAADGPFGTRHHLGNVWQLTRTFYDMHPKVAPRPPADPWGLFNYALAAKGGSWGDGWYLLQLSTRTGQVGNASLGLRYRNRSDSLGFRLARHPQPGYDLMLHSLRRLSLNPARGTWADPFPHAHALERMDGADEIHVTPSESPYLHVKEKAVGIAFAPLWFTEKALDRGEARKLVQALKKGGKRVEMSNYYKVGSLRIDVPFRAGQQLTEVQWAALLKARKEYKEKLKAWKDQQQRIQKKKLKKGEEVLPEPVEPPQPDAYEEATEHIGEWERKQKPPVWNIGVWREADMEPGEYTVVYWYGFLGLTDKSGIIKALLHMEEDRKGPKAVDEIRGLPGRTTLTVVPKDDVVNLQFACEIQSRPKKPEEPPGIDRSEWWALCETRSPRWSGWPGRRPGKKGLSFRVAIKTAPGALAKHNWNQD